MNPHLKKFLDNNFNNFQGKALDLGSGDGDDINYLRDKGWFCEGVDKKAGIDLNNIYISEKGPFDIVFSNYVLHFIKNKDIFLKTIYKNLKKNGWLFLHTFHKDDVNIKKGFELDDLIPKISKYFHNINTEILDIYDDDPDHNHWHKVIQVTAQK